MKNIILKKKNCGLAGAGLVLVAMIFPLAAPRAQTDLSLRIRSLGEFLAGITDDELTDIFLNPARAGLISTEQVYMAYLPSRRLELPFPSMSNPIFNRVELLPDEGDYSSWGFTPIAFSYVVPIGETLRSSLGFEVFTSNSDNMDSNSSTTLRDYYSGDYINTQYMESANRNAIDHFLCDGAIAGSVGKGFIGVRLKGSYDRKSSAGAFSRTDNKASIETIGESSTDYDYSYSSNVYERTAFAVSGGIYKTESVLKDLVLTFEGVKHVFPGSISNINYENSDTDGNGRGFYGGTPTLNRDKISFDSHRDYLQVGFFMRAHLNLPKELKSVNEIAWLSAGGDGAAEFHNGYFHLDSPYDQFFDEHIGYDYDGSFTKLYIGTTLGRSQNIGEDLLFIWGLKAAYMRWDFDEKGMGDISLVYSDEYFPDSVNLATLYAKRNTDFEESISLIIPAGLEWNIKDTVLFRIGAQFVAVHSKTDRAYTQEISEIISPVSISTFQEEVDDHLSYISSVQFTNGFEVKFTDKLVLDLYTASSINLASYGYLSLQYRF